MKENLPPELQALLHDEQYRIEKVITYLQLVVVAFVCIMHVLTSFSFVGRTLFDPIYVALFIYLPFTLVKLYAVYKQRWVMPLLYLSIVMDNALVAMMVWSFHLEYLQPPAFSLKAPTFMYFFFFLALSSLRFEMRYLVLSGTCAIVSWFTLLSYAILDSRNSVTRDFVEGLQSNKIYIGAEVEHLIALIAVTAVLAYGIYQVRVFLKQAFSK